MKAEDLDRFPGAHLLLVCGFFFIIIYYLNAKLLHILVKWHHQNDRNVHPLTFYIELRMKPMGLG